MNLIIYLTVVGIYVIDCDLGSHLTRKKKCDISKIVNFKIKNLKIYARSRTTEFYLQKG